MSYVAALHLHRIKLGSKLIWSLRPLWLGQGRSHYNGGYQKSPDFPCCKFCFVPRWSLWSGRDCGLGGGGVHPPPPPVVVSRSNTSLGMPQFWSQGPRPPMAMPPLVGKGRATCTNAARASDNSACNRQQPPPQPPWQPLLAVHQRPLPTQELQLSLGSPSNIILRFLYMTDFRPIVGWFASPKEGLYHPIKGGINRPGGGGVIGVGYQTGGGGWWGHIPILRVFYCVPALGGCLSAAGAYSSQPTSTFAGQLLTHCWPTPSPESPGAASKKAGTPSPPPLTPGGHPTDPLHKGPSGPQHSGGLAPDRGDRHRP